MTSQVSVSNKLANPKQQNVSPKTRSTKSRFSPGNHELLLDYAEEKSFEEILKSELKLLLKIKDFKALKVTAPSCYTTAKAERLRKFAHSDKVLVSDFLPTYGQSGAFVFWVNRVNPQQTTA